MRAGAASLCRQALIRPVWRGSDGVDVLTTAQRILFGESD